MYARSKPIKIATAESGILFFIIRREIKDEINMMTATVRKATIKPF
jgi:hypothetical protein